MDLNIHICKKKMQKEMFNSQNNKKTIGLKLSMPLLKVKRIANAKEWVQFTFALIITVTWTALSVQNNDFFFKEILGSTIIINCIMFLRALSGSPDSQSNTQSKL